MFNLLDIEIEAYQRTVSAIVLVQYRTVNDETPVTDVPTQTSRRRGSATVADRPTTFSEIGSALQGSRILRTN